jgi:two-component system sensor histidine kinase AlgZ
METYLELETYRLGERLRVSRSVEESALEQPVPTFSLQPLVENAVRHGIAPRAAGGRISVESRVEGSTLRLRVTNDGNDGGAASETDEGGLGLRVLRDRLEVLYRGLARMTAGPTAEGGFDVILELPLRAIETENGP